MPSGGCKAQDLFTMHAQPTLAARCVTCHGGANNTATNAVDMRKVTDLTMAGQAVACAQVRNRVNPTTPSMSTIFNVTSPSSMGAHPYKFPDAMAHDAFVQEATKWIAKEQ